VDCEVYCSVVKYEKGIKTAFTVCTLRQLRWFVEMGVYADLDEALALASLPGDVDGYISICGYGSLLSLVTN
jgi:hypothetical protein